MGSTVVSKKEKGFRIFLSERDLEQCNAKDVPQAIIKEWIVKGRNIERMAASIERQERELRELKEISINFFKLATYVLAPFQYDIERVKAALKNGKEVSNEDHDKMKLAENKLEMFSNLLRKVAPHGNHEELMPIKNNEHIH